MIIACGSKEVQAFLGSEGGKGDGDNVERIE